MKIRAGDGAKSVPLSDNGQENSQIGIKQQIMAYRKEEIYDQQTTQAIAEHYREILRLLGEDPEREGLVKTPERVAKALQFLTHGSQQDGAEILRSAIFKEEYS